MRARVRVEPHEVHAFAVVLSRADAGLADHFRRGRDDARLAAARLEHLPPVVHPQPAPKVRTRRCGLPTRILSRRSSRSPFITPSTTISALTPTTTPPVAITLLSEAAASCAGSAGSARRCATRAVAASGGSTGHRRSEIDPASSTLRPHRRKEDHVADGRLVGEEHEQPVDADARRRPSAACRTPARACSPRRTRCASSSPAARCRACSSNRRRWSSGSFSSLNAFASSLPADEQLEPLGERRIAAVRLGQRRERHRIVDDEGRLDQVRLDERLEQLVQQLAAGSASRPLSPSAPARSSTRAHLLVGRACAGRAPQRAAHAVDELDPRGTAA